jgi:Holliday junction DNA helicase RuvA
VIARVRGLLIEKNADSALLEAGGLAYEVFLPGPAAASLPELGREVVLHTHFHVREDAQVLYGFLDPSDRRVFLMLMTVTGVGPRLALGILSNMDVPTLVAALVHRDLAVLTRVPGVGKKLAERLGVELSDKAKQWTQEQGPLPQGSKPGNTESRFGQAQAALQALGYSQNQARQAADAALGALGPSASLESLVKEALKAV